MTFQQACKQLRQHTVRAVRPGLSRTKKLLFECGSPDQFLPAVHITGSNGKGSVASMLATVLLQAGYRIGKFTSPHLQDERERIVINGRMVSKYIFIQAVQVLLPALHRLEQQGDAATTFEAWTVLAAIVFQRKKVDLVILEVGMGGRLDATTIWQHRILTILTNIHLEHTAYLGDTKAAICREKLGIVKKRVPLVSGVSEPGLRRLIRQAAQAHKSPLFYSGYHREDDMRIMHYKVLPTGFCIDFEYQKTPISIKIPLKGRFQVSNAALACLAIKILIQSGYEISEQNFITGMNKVVWPGRMEKIHKAPTVYLDGSHNPAAVSAAIEDWVKKGEKIFLIVGIMADKAVLEMVRNYTQIAKKIWTVTPPDKRGLSAQKLAEYFRKYHSDVVAVKSVFEAMKKALKAAHSKDTLLVTGSLYLIAPGRRALKRLKKSNKKQ